jgi:hypothetical protein
MLSRIHLRRVKDFSGISGTGESVAAGVVFEDGSVVIQWNSSFPSIEIHSSVENLMVIHGHKENNEYTTQIVYDDPPPIKKTN